MTYSQMTGAMMSKPKITICPPAEQDVFFQETQFDENIGPGTNPILFWQGNIRIPSDKERTARNANVGLAKSKKKKLKEAAIELEGHESKEEILKILRSE